MVERNFTKPFIINNSMTEKPRGEMPEIPKQESKTGIDRLKQIVGKLPLAHGRQGEFGDNRPRMYGYSENLKTSVEAYKDQLGEIISMLESEYTADLFSKKGISVEITEGTGGAYHDFEGLEGMTGRITIFLKKGNKSARFGKVLDIGSLAEQKGEDDAKKLVQARVSMMRERLDGMTRVLDLFEDEKS